MDDSRKKFIEAVKQGTNILVTVKRDPSIDGLAAAIGLSLVLNGLGKHATAVFSGNVPPVLEFLNPGETLHKTTDSLQDFIISLDKAKADKLRYKVEDQVVKIFITPYKAALSEKDLQFGQGDFNVDVVVALGVHSQQELDEAVTAHGRILHDATVVSLNIDGDKVEDLGSINWVGSDVSGLSQMVLDAVDDVAGDKNDEVLDNQVATALLTGIVAETERFSNGKTTPKVMQASARLLEAGANQELVASKLAPPPAEEHKSEDKPDDNEGGEDKKEPEGESGNEDDKKDEDKEDEAKKDDEEKDGGKPAEDKPDDAPEEAKPADDTLHVDHGVDHEVDHGVEHEDEPKDEQPVPEIEEKQPEHQEDAREPTEPAVPAAAVTETAAVTEEAGSAADATPAVDVEAPEPQADEPAAAPVPYPESAPGPVPEPAPEPPSEPVAEAEAPPSPEVPVPGPAPEEPVVPEDMLPSKYERKRNERSHELVLQPLAADVPGVSDVHRTLTPENDPMDATGMIGSALQAEAAAREVVQPYDMNRISVPASVPMAPPVIPASQAAWLPSAPAGGVQPGPAPMPYPSPMPMNALPLQPFNDDVASDRDHEHPIPSADEQAAMAILQQGKADGEGQTRIQPLRDQYAFVAEPPLPDKKHAAGNDAAGKPVDETLDPTKFALTPPILGGTLTASSDSTTLDPSTDPLSAQIIRHRPIMTHDPHEMTAPSEVPDPSSAVDPESLPSGAAAPPHSAVDEPLAGVGHTIAVPPAGSPDASAMPEPEPRPEPVAVEPGVDVTDATAVTAQLAAADGNQPGQPAGKQEEAEGPAKPLEAAISEESPAEDKPAAPEPEETPQADAGPAKPLEAAISNEEPQPVEEKHEDAAEPEVKASSKPLEAAISDEAPQPESEIKSGEKSDAKADEAPAKADGPQKPLEAALAT